MLAFPTVINVSLVTIVASFHEPGSLGSGNEPALRML